MKKITSLALAGCLLIGGVPTSFAYTSQDQVIPQVISQPILHKDVVYNKLVIHNKEVDLGTAKIYNKEDGVTMLPLRIVAEELGYEVKWNGETNSVEVSKGAHWTMVKNGVDAYSFARMAPMKLGAAPEAKEGAIYVPSNFVSEILKLNISLDPTGVINISDEALSIQEAIATMEGEIIDIKVLDKYSMITIENKMNNLQMVFNINNDTQLIDPITNETLTIDDFEVGDRIRGFYGPAVTASLPPQSNAKKVELLENITVSSGTITSMNKDDKYQRIFIGDHTSGMVLTLSEDTKIVTTDNKEIKIEDLEEGMTIEAYHSLAMTMSLPPITNAKRIVVNTPMEQSTVDNIYVADAAKYRGELINIEKTQDGTEFTVKKIEGDYLQAEEMTFIIDDNTRVNKGKDQLKLGQYIEIYYGAGVFYETDETAGSKEDTKEIPNAIGINILEDKVDFVMFVGDLKEIMEKDDSVVSILLENKDFPQGIIFHINDESIIDSSLKDIRTGSRVEIKYNGITLESLPPQASIMELKVW